MLTSSRGVPATWEYQEEFVKTGSVYQAVPKAQLTFKDDFTLEYRSYNDKILDEEAQLGSWRWGYDGRVKVTFPAEEHERSLAPNRGEYSNKMV